MGFKDDVKKIWDPFRSLNIKKSDLTEKQQRDVLKEAADELRDAMFDEISKTTSPVTGSKFRPLSKAYRIKKKAGGGSPKPNLEFQGDMLDSVRVRVDEGKIVVDLSSEKQAAKADGHNNFSGSSTLPRRPFIPRKRETWSSKIRKRVKTQLKALIEDEE